MKKLQNKTTYLFVDGTNLYAGQYELFGPRYFLNFQAFIVEIEKELGTNFDKIYFYASYSPRSKKPTSKEKMYLKNEALFYWFVRKTNKIVFFKGYRSKASGKEKEVDVKLTADLISLAFLDKYETAYLMTGDADFLQALFTVRKYLHKKRVRLFCFENKVLYQGLFYFKTYIAVIKKRPTIKKGIKTLTLLRINSEKVIVRI